MPRITASLLLLAAVACAKPDQPVGGDSAAATPATDAASGAAPAVGANATAMVTVMYNAPKDTAAFEKYYRETHVPLVGGSQQAIGFTRAELIKFPRNLDGSAPAHYRQAILWFDSMEALERGVKTPEFKKVADDLPNFATGGLIALVGNKTN